ARQLRPEDRRLPLGGIGLHHPRQEVESGFVHENKHPAFASRPLPQLRPDFVPPALDGFLVPLNGSPDRHLGRPVQLLEQPADVVFVVADAKLLLDHLGDAGTGPYLTPKPVSFRAMPQELRDQTLLSGREFGRASGTGVSAEGLRPAVADTGKPTAYTHGGDAQRLGDVTPRPALPLQMQRSKPPPHKPVRRKLIRVLHTPILCGEKCNFLCAAVSKGHRPLFKAGYLT